MTTNGAAVPSQAGRTLRIILIVAAIVVAIWVAKKFLHARSMCSDWCNGVANWSEFISGEAVNTGDRTTCTSTCSWTLFFDKFDKL